MYFKILNKIKLLQIAGINKFFTTCFHCSQQQTDLFVQQYAYPRCPGIGPSPRAGTGTRRPSPGGPPGRRRGCGGPGAPRCRAAHCGDRACRPRGRRGRPGPP